MNSVSDRWWISALLTGIVVCAGTLVSAADSALAESSGVLHLTNGSYVAGQLLDSASADILDWQGTQFTAPFRFPLSHVHSIVYPQPAALPKPAGEFCFELSGGGVLFGSLRGVADDLIEIDEAKLGRVSIRLDRLHRFFRWDSGSELIFSGPTGLKGWSEKSAESQWREDGGQLVTDQPEAQLTGDFKLPAQVTVEFELSWTKRPNFSLALGGGQRPGTLGQAFRLEIVDSELVALRETLRAADIAAVTPLGPTEGHVHLLVYLDQERGDLLVYSMTGARLAELHVAEAKPQIGGSLTLTNIQGDVRLQRLRISRWNGVAPTNNAGTQPRFQRDDGLLQDGRLTGFDPDQQQFTFRSGDQVIPVPLLKVDDVLLSASDEDQSAQETPRNLHIIYHDGTRISGTLTQTGAAAIGLKCPEIVQAVTAPVKDLRGITILTAQSPQAADLSQRETLELPDTKLRGRLTDGRELPNASCLTWQPEFSETASPMFPGVAGRIVYRTPPPPVNVTKAANPNRQPAPRRMLNLGQVLQDQPAAQAPAKLNPKDQKFLHHFIHLRSGDTIPCEVKSIDERGVAFETPMSEATFVSHEKIKAVELIKSTLSPKLSQQKRDRLLMLPRMHRDSPPMQLICSRNGDMLRGRVLSLTETQLKVEVRLDERELARDRVAQIIWLHADELKDEPAENSAPREPPAQVPATRVQVQRSDGIRLTFLAEQLQEATLSGRSDVLGDCRTDLAQVDQLLIGAAIELAAANLPYHRWKLHHALDPKFVAEENGESDPGQDSPLVGKPAPDFKLEFLDGTKFHLAECQGQVVVLDFWATWCGPCLQVMPQVEQVAGEFQESNVRLVAVNLEESPKQITDTLARHKIDVPVVLDQDGVVAHKYQATAIPQTVIIDRTGRVFRVFVGGGPDYADQLREALKIVTEEKPPGDDAGKNQESLPDDSQKSQTNP